MLSTSLVAAQSFNLEVILPQTYHEVVSDSTIYFTINLVNLDNPERIDVVLNYYIVKKDESLSQKNIIVSNSKTVAIETQASFVGNLHIPKDLPAGEYELVTIVNSSLGDSTARTSFKIIGRDNRMIIYVALIVLFIIILAFLFIKSWPIINNWKLHSRIKDIIKKKLKK
jgi:hypothetical protein